MNVVIWARVSSREQKEGYSIDAQLRTTRDRALKTSSRKHEVDWGQSNGRKWDGKNVG